MDSPLHYQPYLDQLIAFASAEPRKPELLSAKAKYFSLTGEIFEDDKVFEMRMASFFDYYLYDWVSSSSGMTSAAEYLADRTRAGLPAEDLAVFRGFTETVHGVFQVRKMGKGIIRLREPFSGKDHDVTERRHIAGLEKGDLIEARLIPFKGHLLFSGAFCYHPRMANDAILKEIKRRKKKQEAPSAKEMAWGCAKRALKVERYRQIPAEKIYDFTSPSPI